VVSSTVLSVASTLSSSAVVSSTVLSVASTDSSSVVVSSTVLSVASTDSSSVVVSSTVLSVARSDRQFCETQNLNCCLRHEQTVGKVQSVKSVSRHRQ